MDGAEPDVLASMNFPKYHRVKIHSTNPIERVNGEIKRRTEVVGIFPNEAAIVRLADAGPLEQNDEWAVQRAHYMTLYTIAPLRDDPLVSLPAVAPDQPGARCRRTRRPGHDHQMCLWSRSERKFADEVKGHGMRVDAALEAALEAEMTEAIGAAKGSGRRRGQPIREDIIRMDTETHRKERLHQFLVNRRAILMGGAAAAALPCFSRTARAGPSTPMHFIGWQYNPQIVSENVDTFKKLYDENVEYELVPGEYHAIAETKLMAGQHIDMMYSEEDRIVRWKKAGWTRTLDGLPGLDAIKASMYPVNVKDMSLPNGGLGGLPYYTGFNSFVANEKHLDAAKLQPPSTWEEFLDQCRKLKRDKVAEFPYISAWGRQWASLSWSLFAIWYSEGAKVFGASFDPVFDQPFKKVLEMHRTIYRERIIPPDVFTQQGESVPNFATGQHTYMVVHDYDQKVFNTPATSHIAGAARNFIMPGKTRSTFVWTAVYQMGAKPVDEMRVWNLMQFFGGKAKDGQYHVARRWALEFGLGTPYKEVIEDPEVQKSFSVWKDMKIATQQFETATTRDVAKAMWFPEWDWFMMGEVQDYIRGQGSTDELVDKLQKKAAEVKALYPE